MRRRLALCSLLLLSACSLVSVTPRTERQLEGRLAPRFELPSHTGEDVALDDLLARGPAVLVFYRGHW